jgi:HSP20 family protein
MTFYVTPYRHAVRRWARPYREENWNNEVESEVFVPVNVKSDGDDFVISALLPGVKAEDLSIQVVNETVTIQGEIPGEVEDGEAQKYLVQEQPAGKFYRVIRLPEPLDTGKAEADLTDGVLKLRVPKAEEARPRTIKVKNLN